MIIIVIMVIIKIIRSIIVVSFIAFIPKTRVVIFIWVKQRRNSIQTFKLISESVDVITSFKPIKRMQWSVIRIEFPGANTRGKNVVKFLRIKLVCFTGKLSERLPCFSWFNDPNFPPSRYKGNVN